MTYEIPEFCALCDAPADAVVGENLTPLCSNHLEAYEWGQNSPDAVIILVGHLEAD